MIQPRIYHRVLTTLSATLDQRVQVYSHPHVYPCPYYGETGTIKAFPDPQHYRAIAGVRLDGFPNFREVDGTTLTWIPLHQLVSLE